MATEIPVQDGDFTCSLQGLNMIRNKPKVPPQGLIAKVDELSSAAQASTVTTHKRDRSFPATNASRTNGLFLSSNSAPHRPVTSSTGGGGLYPGAHTHETRCCPPHSDACDPHAPARAHDALYAARLQRIGHPATLANGPALRGGSECARTHTPSRNRRTHALWAHPPRPRTRTRTRPRTSVLDSP